MHRSDCPGYHESGRFADDPGADVEDLWLADRRSRQRGRGAGGTAIVQHGAACWDDALRSGVAAPARIEPPELGPSLREIDMRTGFALVFMQTFCRTLRRWISGLFAHAAPRGGNHNSSAGLLTPAVNSPR